MNETLSACINAALGKRGRRIALVTENGMVSGNELRARALDLAAACRAHGLKAGDTVGLFVDRSVDSVAAILAILDLHCAYLPLDPTMPQQWLSHLLRHAQAQVLLFPSGLDNGHAVASSLAPLLPLGTMSASAPLGTGILGKVAIRPRRRESRLAYVMGTSGTTGEPKAVPIRESSLLHYCHAFAARVGGPEVLAGMRMASTTTLAADLGNTMVFPSLLFGGELHLMPQAVTRDPLRFADYVQEHDIGVLKVVPTHLRVLLDQGASVLPSQLLIVGGESFGLDLLARLEACRPTCAVFNHYGPTEATIGVAMYQVSTTPGTAESLRDQGHRSVPIGTALGDNQLRVVDEELNPCIESRTGELVVSGPSVAEGYLGSSDQSRPRFIEANWSSYGLVYRTGDLARLCSSGEFELFGRIDRQFKVRGHRVEAAVVEGELRAHPGVFDAFVDIREQGKLGAALLAWVHADNGIDESALRTFLSERVPEPMVPSRIIVMDALPRTPNGKIDSRSLPGPHAVLPADGPCSIEEAVVRVFSKVLALPLEAARNNFFRLGGHSLAALEVICCFRQDHGFEVRVEDFYADATPSGLARAARPVTPQGTGPRETEVSPQVHALWAYQRLNPHDTTYEIPVRLRVMGSATPERIGKALTDFVARHETLRTRFTVNAGKPVPVVDDHVRSTLKIGDGTDTAADIRLDIENGPLVRGTVTAVGPGECLIDLLAHHIAYDGISTGILVRELAAMLGGEPLLPPPKARTGGRMFQSQRSAPLGDGARARFGLPAPQPQRLRDNQSRRHELRLPAGLWGRIEAYATVLKTTPFVIATAAWALVLSRQDRERAVTICTPADLRDPFLTRTLVGYHTNLVVIEVEHLPEDTVSDLIQRTHCAIGRALQDRHRPYATRVADQRAATGTPPARTLLTVERLERNSCAGIQIEQEPVSQARSVFDVDISIVTSGQTTTIQVHHRADVCPEGRARCLGDQLSHVLGQFAAGPKMNSADVSILPATWADQVMEWSRGPAAIVSEEWGAWACRKHVLADPDATALVWPGGEWSRSKFAEEVVRTARILRNRGLGPGTAVAVAVSHSPALAVAWHAAHTVGAAVLALDPAWPQHRLDTAARKAQADVRISSPDGITMDVIGSARTPSPHDPELAYFILTSGSTGEPKLVAVQHSALANELSWCASTLGIEKGDRVLAHSSPGFDVTVWDMLGPLAWGACLVLPAKDRRNDVPHLAELIHDQRVTVIQAVPSLLEALLSAFVPGRSSLRLLLSGGEEMPPSLPLAVAQRLPKATLLNTYGPSETAIDVTFYHVERAIPPGARVPLGKPIAGTCAYVVDDRYRLLPPGTWGQLVISGNSVGRGYLGDAVATSRQFVPDPFTAHPGARMYLTGDRARWNDEGVLEFGGRQDHQVKVRGNRVELEEVEAALRMLPMVRDAVVHLQYEGTMRARLAALVVPSEQGAFTVRDLHRRSSQLLPSYMTPSVFGLIESVPRLSNGKVARDALPLDVLDAPAPPAEWQTEMETRVGWVWSEVLDNKTVQRDLPFFASGGTSLLIPVLQMRLREAVGVTLSVPELFEHTTISLQAAAIEQRTAGLRVGSSVVSKRGQLRRQAYAARAKGSL